MCGRVAFLSIVFLSYLIGGRSIFLEWSLRFNQLSFLRTLPVQACPFFPHVVNCQVVGNSGSIPEMRSKRQEQQVIGKGGFDYLPVSLNTQLLKLKDLIYFPP